MSKCYSIIGRKMTPTNAEKYFGFILLKLIENQHQHRLVEFLCAHNTQTMFVGYMNTNQNKVTVNFQLYKFMFVHHHEFFVFVDFIF